MIGIINNVPLYCHLRVNRPWGIVHKERLGLLLLLLLLLLLAAALGLASHVVDHSRHQGLLSEAVRSIHARVLKLAVMPAI
jgi:hypothetical protein